MQFLGIPELTERGIFQVGFSLNLSCLEKQAAVSIEILNIVLFSPSKLTGYLPLKVD
jgi:hypothetical protein